MLDVLLPRRCLICGNAGSQLCVSCREGLPRLRPPLCERCGAPTAWPVERCSECSGRRLGFATARAAVPYDDAVRRFVGAWKERGLRRLAFEAASLMAESIASPPADVVTFVPADRRRSGDRGHHPAERLGHALAAQWQLPFRPLLTRVGPSHRQRGLTLVERRRNVAGAFSSRPVSDTVLLVDDVYTSGATVSAAATALRSAGAKTVYVVTFARTIRFHRAT